MKIRVEGVVAAQRAVEDSPRRVEIGNVTVRFQTIERVGEGDLAMRLLARAHDTAPQGPRLVSYRPHTPHLGVPVAG